MTNNSRMGDITVDWNYPTLEAARRGSHPLWIRQGDERGCCENIELTLEQARWLMGVLKRRIRLLSAEKPPIGVRERHVGAFKLERSSSSHG